jgi:predicted HicB family RNase H-like nuclease
MKQLDFVEQEAKAPAGARKPAKPKRKNRPAGNREDLQRLNLEIPKALHKRLKVKAIYEDRTVTDLVLQAINDYLNTH